MSPRHCRCWYVYLALTVVAFTPCLAQEPNEPRSDEIFYAIDFATGSSTGGINEAIAACGQGFSSNGCTVILPRGVVEINETITVGTNTGANQPKYGLVIRGHGSGIETNSSFSTAGTTLLWTGTTSGPVMRIWDVSWARIEDFAIDGNSEGELGGTPAAIGIDYVASNCQSSGQTHSNTLENIFLEDFDPATGHGIGIRATPTPTPLCHQVSDTTFRKLFMRDVDIAYQQDGQQTVDMSIQDSMFVCKHRCVELLDGDMRLENTYLGTSDFAADADVYISNKVKSVLLLATNHETCSKSVIKTEGGSRHYPTTLIDSVIQHYIGANNPPSYCGNQTQNCGSGGCRIVDHHQPGPFNLIGGHYFTYVTPPTPVKFSFCNQTGSPCYGVQEGPLRVFSAGNKYGTGVEWDPIDGSTYLQALDTFKAPFYSLTWDTKNIGTGTDYPMVLTSRNASTQQLTMLNRFNNNGSLIFMHPSTGMIDFTCSGAEAGQPGICQAASSGATIRLQPGALSGSSTGTITIPHRPEGGTIRLTTDTDVVTLTGSQVLTNKDLSSGNIFPPSLATLTGSQTLTNKTLTDSTNVLPALGLISFQGSISGNGDRFLGPGGAVDTSSETNVQAPMPALTARSLRCRAAAALPSGDIWTINLRRSGTNVLSDCTLNSSNQSCSVTGTATYSSNELMSVKANGQSNPSSRVHCTVSVGY